MPRFRVVYQQREVREGWIEAPTADAAAKECLRLRNRDCLPGGSFISADEQEVIALYTEDGTDCDWLDSPTESS